MLDTLKCEYMLPQSFGIAAADAFDVLKDEYDELWKTAKVRPERVAAVDAIAHKLLAYQPRYQAAEKQTGVPWFVIAAWHNRESDADFSAQLAQGDPLDQVSHNEPAGRGPFDTWEEGAVDALVTLKHLDQVKDWSPARICYETERYNGFGYRNHHPDVKSPYLWSFTAHYNSGKYIADGRFSASAVDKQCGAIPIMKRLMELTHTDHQTVTAKGKSIWATIFDMAMTWLRSRSAPAKPLDLVGRLDAAMRRHKYKIFTGPGELNIVYVTGANLDGSKNDNAPDKWNDLRCVYAYDGGKPVMNGLWVCTTEPGFYYGREHLLNSHGAAHLAPGQYDAWQTGYHRGDSDRFALVQTGGDVTVWRDANRNFVRDDTDPIDVGGFGINEHDGQDGSPESIGTHSAGCLVVRERAKHAEFMKLVTSDPRWVRNHRFIFTTALLLSADLQ